MRPQLCRHVAITIALLASSASTARAQQNHGGPPASLRPGEYIRLRVPGPSASGGRELWGTVVRLDDSALVLRTAGVDTILRRRELAGAELRVHTRLGTAGKGLLLGAGIGAALGAALGSDCPNGTYLCITRSQFAAGYGALGALVGVAVGAARGSDHWVPANLALVDAEPRPALGSAPTLLGKPSPTVQSPIKQSAASPWPTP
ncbi:MAG: hypothetical protein NVS4B3_27020 [Gemmatimonadaceae bacterium]